VLALRWSGRISNIIPIRLVGIGVILTDGLAICQYVLPIQYMRSAVDFSIKSRKSGNFSSSNSKLMLRSVSRRHGVNADTVAMRGTLRTRAISPK